MRKLALGIMLGIALLASACGNIPGGEKIAVVDWEKAVSAHPQSSKLKQGEAIYKNLAQQREHQAELAASQMRSVQKLQQLKQLSRKNYLSAEFNMQMFNQRVKNSEKLQKLLAEAQNEAEALIADRKKQVESDYQLRIFNLRLKLQTMKLKPEERDAIKKELLDYKAVRETQLKALQEEKQAYITQKMQPYIQEIQQELAAKASEYQDKMALKLQADSASDEADLKSAPVALQNALAIMDREIEKQRQYNAELTETINGDIKNAAVSLANERGYSVVFKQYKANVHADDITDDIISRLKKQDK